MLNLANFEAMVQRTKATIKQLVEDGHTLLDVAESNPGDHGIDTFYDNAAVLSRAANTLIVDAFSSQLYDELIDDPRTMELRQRVKRKGF
jgi:hypothetical protein